MSTKCYAVIRSCVNGGNPDLSQSMCHRIVQMDGKFCSGRWICDRCRNIRCASNEIAVVDGIQDDDAAVIGAADRSTLGKIDVGDHPVGGHSQSQLVISRPWNNECCQGCENNHGNEQLSQCEAATMRKVCTQVSHGVHIGQEQSRVNSNQGWQLRRRCSGFTLVEALLAVIILSIAILGLSYATTAGHEQLHQSERTLRATRLAEHLIEEILGKPYTGSGADRASYCLDDYDSFVELPGEIERMTGGLYADVYQGFTREVSVVGDSKTIADYNNVVIVGKTVTVTVTDTNGVTYELNRFIPGP